MVCRMLVHSDINVVYIIVHYVVSTIMCAHEGIRKAVIWTNAMMQCAFILGVDLLYRMWSWPCSGSVLSTFPVTITDKTTKCRLTACTGLAPYGAENCYSPHYILAASQLVKLWTENNTWVSNVSVETSGGRNPSLWGPDARDLKLLRQKTRKSSLNGWIRSWKWYFSWKARLM